MDREAWRAAIHGVAKSRTRLRPTMACLTYDMTIFSGNRQWKKRPVFSNVKPRGHTEFTTYPPIFNLTPKEGTVSSHAPSEAQHVL